MTGIGLTPATNRIAREFVRNFYQPTLESKKPDVVITGQKKKLR